MPHKKTTANLVSESKERAVSQKSRPSISLIIDNVRSLDNVGMIIRTAELARLAHVYLTGYTGYPETAGDTRPSQVIARHNSRINKTAVYALAHQPWSRVTNPVPLVKKLRKERNTIIALEQTDHSISYNKLPVTGYQLPVTLVLGHERQGVRQELLDLADHVIDIPILGQGNSHNVAIACAIVLYHLLDKMGAI